MNSADAELFTWLTPVYLVMNFTFFTRQEISWLANYWQIKDATH